MGYSCSARAALTLDALQAILTKETPQAGSNALPGGFWERGREQRDGAITGTVWKTIGTYTPEQRAAKAAEMGISNPEWIGDPVRKAGSFKINADGTIARFPMVPLHWRITAIGNGAREYQRRYGAGPYVNAR